MNTKLCAILAAVAVSAPAGRATAQALNVAATPAAANVLSTSAGLDNGLVTSLGYGRAVQAGNRTLILGGDLTLPWAGLDVSDFRLRLRGVVPIVGEDEWRLLAELMPGVRGTESAMNRMTNISLEANVLGGYYSRRWFAAAELGGAWSALTHIQHSEHFRRSSYALAKDGWYGTTGATVRAGLVAGYSFSAFDLVVRAGQERDQNFNTLAMPVYLSLGLNARLPF